MSFFENLFKAGVAGVIAFIEDAVDEGKLEESIAALSFDDLNKAFEGRKTSFLKDVETAIRNYIIGTGKQCVAVVEKMGFHERTHELHLDNATSFAEVLICFMRGRQYNGHDLDSALNQPVIELIEQKYVAFFKSFDKEISEEFISILRKDGYLRDRFVERLCDKVIGEVSEEVRKKVVHKIAEGIHESTKSQTAHVISQHVHHFTSTAVGAQVATITAHLLIKVIALNLPKIVASLLAQTILTKSITALLHKTLAGMITAAVTKFLLANIGGAIGASAVMWIILPIVAAILVKQIHDFPRKLGTEVAASVRAHLAENFSSMNNTILVKIYKEIFRTDELLETVAEDEDVQEMMKEIVKEIGKDIE